MFFPEEKLIMPSLILLESIKHHISLDKLMYMFSDYCDSNSVLQSLILVTAFIVARHQYHYPSMRPFPLLKPYNPSDLISRLPTNTHLSSAIRSLLENDFRYNQQNQYLRFA